MCRSREWLFERIPRHRRVDPGVPGDFIDAMLLADVEGPRKQRHTIERIVARLVAEHDFGLADRRRLLPAQGHRRRTPGRPVSAPLRQRPGAAGGMTGAGEACTVVGGERKPRRVEVDRSEGFGERLLGVLLDRAHEMPPQMIAPLIAEEVAGIGGRDVSILLQDYEQMLLVPLPGRRLVVGDPEPIEDSPAGDAFLYARAVEVDQDDGGVRIYMPLLDGSDQVGAMSVTLDEVDDDDRRLLRRLAGLVADMIVTKNAYTDQFFVARRRAPMSLAAEIQWSLLPRWRCLSHRSKWQGSSNPPTPRPATASTTPSTTTSCTWA